MSTIRLAIAVTALALILYSYQHVIANVTGVGMTALPPQQTALEYRPVDMSGCTVVGLNTNGPAPGCPAARGEGVIPAN